MTEQTLLEVYEVRVEYLNQGQRFDAISNITLNIAEGETLGLVGESGCGKSTTGRAIIQLPSPTAGSVKFRGRELTGLGKGALELSCRPHPAPNPGGFPAVSSRGPPRGRGGEIDQGTRARQEIEGQAAQQPEGRLAAAGAKGTEIMLTNKVICSQLHLRNI